MSPNPPRTTATASFVVALFFAVMVFVPGFLGIDGFDGGFAISFVSIVIVAVAVIVGIMYLSWAAKLDKILRGEDIIAHWTYTPEFWAKYTEKEYKEEISEKKGLFIIVSAFALFFGILFFALDQEAGLFVFAVMLLLIGLCAFAWRFSAWNNHRQNVGGVPEVFISRDAIYMNKKFYTWKAVLTSFDGVSIEKTRGVPMLVFKYITINKAGAQTYVTRVPIPPGQEEEAKTIVEQFNVPPPPLQF